MFLSAYDKDAWKDASLNWIEEQQDGSVEVIAINRCGATLALEHTIIQPFVGEKFDSEVFIRAFGCIERNPALIVPGQNLDVIIPVGAIPKGYDWTEVGTDLLAWLVANRSSLPSDGNATFTVPIGKSAKNGPLQLPFTLQTTSLPGTPGNCLIARSGVPANLSMIVEKALTTKLPKLTATNVDRRILMLETDQISLGHSQIYLEIVKLAPNFPALANVDEIWFAGTSGLSSEQFVWFTLMDRRGLVELLTFRHGVMKSRRDDRPHIGPARREF
jgi:hypothetical protein